MDASRNTATSEFGKDWRTGKWLTAVALTLALSVPASADAATYYIGNFNGSAPVDDSSCGLGKTGGANPHPCATLGYWNQNRRTVLNPGDVVRLAPGTYRDQGPAAGSGHHCILLDGKAKGVTFEGRTADDGVLDDHESVVVDMSGVSLESYTGNNPCQAIAISSIAKCRSQDYSDSTVRDMKFTNAAKGGAYLCGKAPDNVSSNITFDRIRLSQIPDRGGIIVGRFDNSYDAAEIDCARGGRTVKDFRLIDSEIDHVKGFPGGIQLACMNGFEVSRNRIHDTCDLNDCSVCTPTMNGCNDRDGIQGSGAINGIIADNEVYNVGEDGIDFGGHPAGKSHHFTLERNRVYGVPKNGLIPSGGRYVLVRNNVTWGRGNGFQAYGGARFVKIHNNTFWNGISFWYYLTGTEVYNNIISSDKAGTGTVFLDWGSTNTSNSWKHNVVLNRAGGALVFESGGALVDTPQCDGWNPGRTRYTISTDMGNTYLPPPVPCSQGPTPSDGKLDASELSQFQQNGASGQFFGPGTGENDRWGVVPSMVNDAVPNASNLHLTSSDTVARGAGMVINVPGVCGGQTPGRCSDGLYGYPCQSDSDCDYNGEDIDGDTRSLSAAWDIGADQFGGGGVPTGSNAAVLLSVSPLGSTP